jgi:hypothetical protein
MLGLSGQTISQTNKQPSIPANVPTSFDIPAQPLVRALDAYSAATGLMVLYDSNLAEGHRSTAVSGVLMPDVAIRTLLEGTGLVVFSAGRAFAIEAGPSDQQDGVVTSNAAEMSYLALVQQAVERSFCEKPETKPGEYRAAVQFRIGISGEILSQLNGRSGPRQYDCRASDPFAHPASAAGGNGSAGQHDHFATAAHTIRRLRFCRKSFVAAAQAMTFASTTARQRRRAP